MASERTLLNYLLQSAGAILSKEWIVQFHKLMKEAGFIHGRDYYQLLWVHDEIQVAIKKSHAKQIQEISIRAIQIAGEIHNLNCPITGESKTGDTWADTH
jgi:DNA polymerase I